MSDRENGAGITTQYVQAMFEVGQHELAEDRVLGEFEDWLNSVKAQAIRDVATGFIDWDVMNGHEETTPETEASHATADYLWNQALRIEKGE